MTQPLRLLSAIAAAAALLLVSGDGAVAQTEHEVTIGVDVSTGVVSVQPDTVYANRGDRIRFVGVDVDSWTVTFGGGTPFANVEFTGVAEGGPPARVVPILPEAAFRSYKYDVSVTVGEDTWVVDPEIIVRPPGEEPRHH